VFDEGTVVSAQDKTYMTHVVLKMANEEEVSEGESSDPSESISEAYNSSDE
jgi:hypothetical protein